MRNLYKSSGKEFIVYLLLSTRRENIRLSQDQMQNFVSPEVICLRDFILCFLKSTDEAVSENIYIGYNILYFEIYFY